MTKLTMEMIRKWDEENKQATVRVHKQLVTHPIRIELLVLHDLLAHTDEDLKEINEFVNFALKYTMGAFEYGEFDNADEFDAVAFIEQYNLDKRNESEAANATRWMVEGAIIQNIVDASKDDLLDILSDRDAQEYYTTRELDFAKFYIDGVINKAEYDQLITHLNRL